MPKKDLKELGDFLDPILSIPVKDRTYLIPAMDADLAVRMEQMIGAGEKAQRDEQLSAADIELVSDDDTQGFYQSIFGADNYQQMREDNLKHVALKHMTAIVFAWTFADFDTALQMWRAEGKAGNREQRRTATRTQQDADTTTKQQASQSTTKPPQGGRGKKS